VSVQSDGSKELILLARLRYGDATRVEVSLQAGCAPGADSTVESILGLELSIIGSLGPLVSGRAGSSTESRSSGSTGLACGTAGRVRNVISSELSAVLACNGEELVSLASLGDLDAVLVGPLLDF
jgi:hypothetical protein